MAEPLSRDEREEIAALLADTVVALEAEVARLRTGAKMACDYLAEARGWTEAKDLIDEATDCIHAALADQSPEVS